MPRMFLYLHKQQRDQDLREQGQILQAQKAEVEKHKFAMDSAKEMAAMGLAADETEARITKLYMESLEKAVNMGLNGMEAIKLVESTFIKSEGGLNAEQPAIAGIPSNPNPSGVMVGQPSNQNPDQLPPMAG